MRKMTARRGLGLAGLIVGLMSVVSPAAADLGLINMTRGVTESSRQIYDLHMTIFLITVVIGVLVFGAMFYSIYRHRKSRGVKPAKFHHSTAVEIVWTVIPLGILVAMAVPATQTLIELDDTSDAEMTVKVTGYQWFWGYEYMDEDVQFLSRLDVDSDRAPGSSAPAYSRPRWTITCRTSTSDWWCRWIPRSASRSLPRTLSTPGGCRISAGRKTPFLVL